jgi:hypothetical protein
MVDPKMPMSNRLEKRNRGHGDAVREDDGLDDKLQKEQSQNAKLCRKMSCIAAILATVLFLYAGGTQMGNGIPEAMSHAGAETVMKQAGLKGSVNADELYPFLVRADATAESKPTLPEFPEISRLEGCQLEYKPSDPVRKKESDWRPMFWIPSHPGSGASNPAKHGNLMKELIEGLFQGESANLQGKDYYNPVKDFHASIRNRLKACVGVSETVGCTSSHPQTPVKVETKKSQFRPETILPIRNPATAIPATYAYKAIAYHDAQKQGTESHWREMRDQWGEGTFAAWMDLIKFWRGNAGKSSYYFTSVYVPFEDIMTTDVAKGAAAIKKLSDAISGRAAPDTREKDFFETMSSQQDYECLWYRTVKEEWKSHQEIFGEYIPAYTQALKDKMVTGLREFADEVEKDSFKSDQDAALVSLLRRYATQIENYVRLEDAQAPKR